MKNYGAVLKQPARGMEFLRKGGKWKKTERKRGFSTQNKKKDTFLEVAAETRWNPEALHSDDSKFCYS
jgi:hypothetical protein